MVGGSDGGFIVGLKVPLENVLRLAGQEPRRTKGATPMHVYPAPPVGEGREDRGGERREVRDTPMLQFQLSNPNFPAGVLTKHLKLA